jgi:hypothetical protein
MIEIFKSFFVEHMMRIVVNFLLLTAMIPAMGCTRLARQWCLKQNSVATAEYDDAKGVHREEVQVGSNWGLRSDDQADFGCMGACGAGCRRTGKENIWAQGCLAHDVCSYRNHSRHFVFDSNCGNEAALATLQAVVINLSGGCGD